MGRHVAGRGSGRWSGPCSTRHTRSFYELVGGMDTLENLLSKVIVSGSQKNVDLLSSIPADQYVMSNLSGLPSHAAVGYDAFRQPARDFASPAQAIGRRRHAAVHRERGVAYFASRQHMREPSDELGSCSSRASILRR